MKPTINEIRMELESAMDSKNVEFNLWNYETHFEVLTRSAEEILKEFSDGLLLEEVVKIWVEERIEDEDFFTASSSYLYR